MYSLIVGKIPQEERKLLSKILDNINVSNLLWEISEDDIYVENNNVNLFPQNIIHQSELSNIISENSYYIISCVAKAFKSYDEITSIESLSDFINSKCKLLILIYDIEYLEVYVKDFEIAKIIFNNMKKNKFKPIYIFDENYRKTFEIW